MWILKDGFLHDDEFPFLNFVTTRSSGDMKDPAARQKACSLNNINPDPVVYAEQVHGNIVAAAGVKDAGTFVKSADGLITAEKNLALAVFTADCLPVFLGAEGKAAGIVHAGWRGVFKRILPEAVKLFEKEFNVSAGDITASIGPHVCSRCYRIGDEIRKAFGLSAAETNFDLAGEAVSQLESSGIKNVSVCGRCTCHEGELFFSYRRDKVPARMMSLIQIATR